MNGAGGLKDLHAVLGVGETAGPEELRRAYLALAVKHHPDRNPGDPEAEERFKELSQAYAVLSDPVARARYERLMKARRGAAAGGGTGPKPAGSSAGPSGRADSSPGPGSRARTDGDGQPGRKAGPADGNAAGPGQAAEPGFEDVLNAFFKSAKGRDLLKDLEAELKKAGLKLDLGDFARWVRDRKAAAASSEPKPWWRRLSGWLTGAGRRAEKAAERYEIRYQLALTGQAAASGTTVEIAYPRDGREHRLKIRIPAGAKDGSRMRLAGQGRLKPDGGRGDLVLTIQVGQRQSVADLWK